MRYELFLRAGHALSPEQQEQISASLGPSSRLTLEPYEEGDAVKGVDLGVDPELPGAGSMLCAAALDLAQAHKLTLFDPQLGRLVTEVDRERIEEQVERTGAFSQAALGLSAPTAQPEGISAGTRVWLVVAGLVALALILTRLLSRLL